MLHHDNILGCIIYRRDPILNEGEPRDLKKPYIFPLLAIEKDFIVG